MRDFLDKQVMTPVVGYAVGLYGVASAYLQHLGLVAFALTDNAPAAPVPFDVWTARATAFCGMLVVAFTAGWWGFKALREGIAAAREGLKLRRETQNPWKYGD